MGIQLVSNPLLSQVELQYECPFAHVWIYLKDKFLEVEFVGRLVYTFVILTDTAIMLTVVAVCPSIVAAANLNFT